MTSGYEAGTPGHVLITGASSGIGAALARRYAAAGVRLTLQGRNAARLTEVAEACRSAGAEVAGAHGDVTARDRMADWVRAADAEAPLDLVIANAGITARSGATAADVLATNVAGVLHTVEPALPLMQARRRGQIALMSSLASFRGSPRAAAYCASKAAVRVWGEGLRARMRPHGVRVSVICPGFVATPMTASNAYPMPFMVPAPRAAEIIARGLADDRPRIAFPWPMYALARLVAALPPDLADRLLERLGR